MKSSLTAPVKDVRTPVPRMETKVIRASPIITAAAVDAVRVGLRTAFWRARLPAAPPNRAPGAPSRNASGRTTREAIIATLTKSARTPPTSARIRTRTSTSDAKTPYEKSASATTKTTADVRTA